MEKVKLPDNFETFNDARKNGFLKIKELKDLDKKVVGTFCTYTPVELILASKAIPVGICSFSDETIPEAEKVLPKNLCPLIKSSYGFALTDKCPYMYFSDLIVGETTCDGKKKMYELLGDIKNTYVMKLPNSQLDETSQKAWLNEVVLLKEKLEDEFGVIISEEDISEAIKMKNEERKLLKELYELSKLSPPPISGMQLQKILYGTQFKFDFQEKLAEIRSTIEKIKSDYQNGVREVSASKKRILITGCPLAGVTEKIITAIEESDGVVVAFENCIGIKNIDNLVDETKDPYEAIAERYLKIGCSVMTPNPYRFESLGSLIRDFKVDGVVEMTLQACHTYNIETPKIRESVESKGLPFISIETDYSTSDISQIKTRISAFLEMMI